MFIITLLLLLYECSGFLSNSFASNTFLSNTFLSNTYNSHLCAMSIVNSYKYNSKSVIVSSYKYSTHILTVVPSSYVQIYSTLRPTLEPTLEPTLQNTLQPTLTPTKNPTTIITLTPTLQNILEPSISFTTDLTLSNVKSAYLDSVAQQSVIIAQALTMNISSDFITFVSSSLSNDVKYREIRLLSYNLLVTTKTIIILQGKYSKFVNNPESLFTTLSTSMTNAVTSGTFTNNLVAVSLQLNSSSTTSASVASIYISLPIIQTNNNTSFSPSSSPSSFSPSSFNPSSSRTNYYHIFVPIFISFITIYLLVYSVNMVQLLNLWTIKLPNVENIV